MCYSMFFFFNDTATTEIYTLSLHDALPILAYLDAFTKLVNEVKGQTLNAKADNATQSVAMAKPGKMYEAANIKSKKVRDLDPGMTLYPSGEKDGLWWKVSDELGNEGWVPSTLFQLAK